MSRKMILYIGAFILFVFALFHIAFWEMFNWKEELLKVSLETAGILKILNLASVYLLLFSAGMVIFISLKKINDFLSKAILIFISGYFLLRIVAGYIYFGWSVSEFIIWLLCLVSSSIFVLAAFMKEKTQILSDDLAKG